MCACLVLYYVNQDLHEKLQVLQMQYFLLQNNMINQSVHSCIDHHHFRGLPLGLFPFSAPVIDFPPVAFKFYFSPILSPLPFYALSRLVTPATHQICSNDEFNYRRCEMGMDSKMIHEWCKQKQMLTSLKKKGASLRKR